VKAAIALIAFVALAAVGLGGYWLGTRSPVGSAAAASATGPAASAPRQLLYYRNPMGLADTSPVPKKDGMGMDYVAVYAGADEGAAAAPGRLQISTDKLQKLGVRTEAARLRVLGQTLRVAGRVEPDERRVAAVVTKFEGYVEKLHVNAIGQAVARGQPLFEVYSPELVAAQREYAIAVDGVAAMKGADDAALGGMKQLAEASLAHLRHWDLSPEQLALLMKTGQTQRTVSFLSPVGGVVTEKKALQGLRFMPGDTLYQITDLSSVWIVADVPEQAIAQVTVGARARVTINAYPQSIFEGRVDFIYPTLKAETRSVPIRIALANPKAILRPAMFAQVELAVGSSAPVLTVPDSAVIASGVREIVFVQVEPGRFEPRSVELGARSGEFVEIVKGVGEGEQVVVAANFLIDAESNLRAALSGFGQAASAAAPVVAAPAAAASAVVPRTSVRTTAPAGPPVASASASGVSGSAAATPAPAHSGH
jgi:Cu(I)/Ag(I) efflux system membrane fusion protein